MGGPVANPRQAEAGEIGVIGRSQQLRDFCFWDSAEEPRVRLHRPQAMTQLPKVCEVTQCSD